MFNARVDDTRRRRARRRLLYLAVGASSVCLFFVTYGAFLAWDSYHHLPHVYAALRARGVPATANLVRCAGGWHLSRPSLPTVAASRRAPSDLGLPRGLGSVQGSCF